jgi:hypothetical protein
MPTARTRRQRLARLAIFAAACVLIAVVVLTTTAFTLARLGVFAFKPLGGDLSDARSDRPGLRVLFIGNSLTFENDTPGLLQQLVASDPENRPLFAVRYTPPGYTFALDTTNHTVADLLESVRWDDVVLQENSNISVLDPLVRADWMDAPARTLVDRIRTIGARPLFFLTSGYEAGNPALGLDSYGAMQDRIDLNYREVAGELSASLVPAGLAWSEALGERPGTDLWQADGLHPSLEGAYLNACVFYAALYHRSPTSTFTAGLSREEATFLQRVAATVARSST